MEKELASISTEKEDHIKAMEDCNVFPTLETSEREGFPSDTLLDIGFTDVHMHIDNMSGRNWKVPGAGETVKYIKDEKIVEAGVIFQEKTSVKGLFNSLEEEEVSCKVLPFYFIHDPFDIDKESFDQMYEEGIVKGIKLHPVYDQYEISYSTLEGVLKLSQDYLSLPILIHLDDRNKTMHLTSPEKLDNLVEEMLEKDTVVPIVLGHSGAYAHPRLVSYKEGTNPPVESYWKKFSKEGSPEYSRLYLIKHALQLALKYPFIYLDTSSCVNKVKAKIMADAINSNPELSKKILLGTDFPIRSQYRNRADGTATFTVGTTVKNQLYSLWNQGLKEEYLLEIASNRFST